MADTPEYEALLRDSLLNNSYDWDVMHAQLKRTQLKSYSYLHGLQHAYISYEEIMYRTSDATGHNAKLVGQLYLDKTFHACVDIDYSLLDTDVREKYRLSAFYKNKITIKDMISHPEIFRLIPILMIDDQVIWDYTLYLSEDIMTFALPFGRSFVLEDIRNPGDDDVVYVDHETKVMIVENEFYQRSVVTKSGIGINMETGYFHFPKTEMATMPNRSGCMFASFHIPNSVGKAYELGSCMIPMYETENYYEGTVSEDVLLELQNFTGTNFYLSMFFITKLTEKAFYDGTNVLTAKLYNPSRDEEEGDTFVAAPLFTITDEHDALYYDPIPVENLMVFKKNDNGVFTLRKNTEMVKLYYPNIYQIIDPTMQIGDEYRIWYFYYSDATDTKYTNIFDFYYMYLRNVFDEGTTMEEIINTIYYNLETTKSDFFNSLDDG